MVVAPSILALPPAYLSLLVGKIERSNMSHADLHTIIQDIIYLRTNVRQQLGRPENQLRTLLATGAESPNSLMIVLTPFVVDIPSATLPNVVVILSKDSPLP